MKHKIKYGIATVVLVSMCSLPLGTTAQASAAKTTKVETAISETKDKITNKVNTIKDKIDADVEKNIGNLVNLHLGNVGSVDVSTSDNVNVNVSDSPININININLININKSK